MKGHVKEMKKMKILILVILVIVIALGGIFIMTKGDRSESDEIKCIVIETPYTNIDFPKEWSKIVHIEQKDNEDGIFVVEFYGSIRDEKDIHLLDISFGSSINNIIGTLEYEKNKEPVSIGVTYYDIKESDGWDADEIIQIQEMQRAAEYSVDRIVQQAGFSFTNSNEN